MLSLVRGYNGALKPVRNLHTLIILVLFQLLVLLLKPRLDPRRPQPVLHLLALFRLPPAQRRRGVHPEPKYAGLISALRFWRLHRGIHLEQDVVERGPEVGAVDYGMS